MMDHAALLRQIDKEVEPYIEQWLDLTEVFAGFRKLATEGGLDWGQIKALLKAKAQDRREGGSGKVDRIIEKADFASAYADMLGLGSNMNEKNFSSEMHRGPAKGEPSTICEALDRAGLSLEQVDPATGELIEEPSGPICGGSAPATPEVGTGTSEASAQLANVRPAPAHLSEPASPCRAVGEAVSRASKCSQASQAVSPTLSEPAVAESAPAEAGQGERVLAERSSVAPPTIPEPVAPTATAAPVEPFPHEVSAPGAPISELTSEPQFLPGDCARPTEEETSDGVGSEAAQAGAFVSLKSLDRTDLSDPGPIPDFLDRTKRAAA